MATSPVSLLTRFFGNTISEAAAFAAGVAIGPVLKPPVRALESRVWQAYPDQPIPPEIAAAIAAERVAAYTAMETEAAKNGFSQAAFADMWGEQLNAPGVGELLTLLRRGDINAGNFQHGLDKAKLEAMWGPELAKLQVGRLSPQEVATMVQRGILPNNGILPVGPPVGGGTVPPMPMVNLDPYVEAAASGYDAPRLEGLTRIVGLPPSPGELLQMLNRGIIDTTDFARGIAEGNIRDEWTPFLQQLKRRLLTPHDGAELQIRGFFTAAQRDALAGLSGMTPADAQHLYDLLGRSIAVHQITTGLARGGTFNGPTTGIPPEYLQSMQRSNIRPEYYSLDYANRYTLPSGFMIRHEAQTGAIDLATTESLLLESGWEPKWATLFATTWTGGATSGSDPHVSKAQTQLWSKLHSSYIAAETDDPTATATLGTVGVAAPAIPQVLSLWQAERALIRAQLSPAQVKKAWAELVVNPATGVAWTQAEALAQLLARGYSQADATTFLAE